MVAISVRCDPEGDGWICAVTLHDAGVERSSHRVHVAAGDLQRFAPAAAEPTALVEQSFGFLLERESPQMILRSFDLAGIERYFPEYEAEIRRRVDLRQTDRDRR